MCNLTDLFFLHSQNPVCLVFQPRKCQMARVVLQEGGDQDDDTRDMAGEEGRGLDITSWSAAIFSHSPSSLG